MSTPRVTEKSSARLSGIDVARLVALVGIMINHIFDPALESLVWWDFHAIGFALLIGVGARYSMAAPRGRWVLVGQALIRAGVLACFGFLLEQLPHDGVSVILVRLALILAAVSLIALLGNRLILAVAIAFLTLAPLVSWWVLANHYSLISRKIGFRSAFVPGAWLRMLVAPYYPVLLWIGVAALGLWVARVFDLTTTRGIANTAKVGGALSLLGPLLTAFGMTVFGLPPRAAMPYLARGDYPTLTSDIRWLWGTGAYLPSTPSLLFSSGVVLLACAGMCWLALALGQSRVWLTLAQLGGMTLSGYFIHVLLQGNLGEVLTAMGMAEPTLWPRFALELGIVMAFLWLWSRLPGRLGKGPLEFCSRSAASVLNPRVAR